MFSIVKFYWVPELVSQNYCQLRIWFDRMLSVSWDLICPFVSKVSRSTCHLSYFKFSLIVSLKFLNFCVFHGVSIGRNWLTTVFFLYSVWVLPT